MTTAGKQTRKLCYSLFAGGRSHIYGKFRAQRFFVRDLHAWDRPAGLALRINVFRSPVAIAAGHFPFSTNWEGASEIDFHKVRNELPRQFPPFSHISGSIDYCTVVKR